MQAHIGVMITEICLALVSARKVFLGTSAKHYVLEMTIT